MPETHRYDMRRRMSQEDSEKNKVEWARKAKRWKAEFPVREEKHPKLYSLIYPTYFGPKTDNIE